MKWNNVLKNRTIENVIAQMVVGAVLATGYIVYTIVKEKREMEGLRSAAKAGLIPTI